MSRFALTSSESASVDRLIRRNSTGDGFAFVRDSNGCNWGTGTKKAVDAYRRWVESSDEDQVDIGKCPDLISGIHGDDPVQVFKEPQEVLQEVVDLSNATPECKSRRQQVIQKAIQIEQIDFSLNSSRIGHRAKKAIQKAIRGDLWKGSIGSYGS